jgi:4-hydroxybenzoate polyprenyltransferase
MMFAQATIGVGNDICDYNIDKISKPWRAIPAGHINYKSAILLAGLLFLLSLIFCSLISIISTFLLATGIGVGLLYSVILKRSVFSWIPYALAYPSLPIWVWISLGSFKWELLLLNILAFPLVLGIHMINQLRDFDEDTILGVRGFVQYLGREKAISICKNLLVLCPLPFILACMIMNTGWVIGLTVGAAIFHWVLLYQLKFGEYRNLNQFRRIFQRLQASGPVMVAAWLLSV